MNKYFRLAVSAALLTLVASRTDWQTVQTAFGNLRLHYWLAAVGLLVLCQIVSALRWKFYTDQLSLPRSLGQLTGFYFIGMYFNLMLPTSVGGDVVRACYLDGKSGKRVSAFASVLLDRLNGLMVLVGLAFVAVLLSPLDLPAWITISVWVIAGCTLGGLASLQIVARLGRLKGTTREQLSTAVRLLGVPRILACTLLLSLLVQAANVVIVWLVGQAIHAPIPATYYWVMVPMVSLLTLLPVSINGMGVREGATTLFLAPLGVEQGTAFTLAFLWFAVYATVSLLGGLVYIFGRFSIPETPAEQPGEVICGSVGSDSDEGRTGQHQKAA